MLADCPEGRSKNPHTTADRARLRCNSSAVVRLLSHGTDSDVSLVRLEGTEVPPTSPVQTTKPSKSGRDVGRAKWFASNLGEILAHDRDRDNTRPFHGCPLFLHPESEAGLFLVEHSPDVFVLCRTGESIFLI